MNARRCGSLGVLLLASCSSLLDIEDPVPRDCSGDVCDPEGGRGGAPSTSGGQPVVAAGSENEPNQAGAGGGGGSAGTGEGGSIDSTPIAGMGGETGGAPPLIECEGEERRCNAYQPQTCASGTWVDDGPACALACVDGGCQTPASCSPESTSTPCADGVSCCETIWIEGGSYRMGDGDEEDEVSYERTVSGFYLDRFEVTVGRFRKFQESYSLPASGEGGHPRIPGTGWQTAWEDLPHESADGRRAVPTDKEDLALQLSDDCDASTWVNGDPELPINCVNWYVAFAFCVYDGGRLPTEAEWNYAAAFGDSQRAYPWSQSPSDKVISSTHATFNNYPEPAPELPTPVGSRPAGRGGFQRFSRGHDDLSGNVAEWTLDQWLETPPETCTENCFASWTGEGDERVVRGGAYPSPYNELRSGMRTWSKGNSIASYWGFRCARDIDTHQLSK